MAPAFKRRCICSVPKVTSFVPEGQRPEDAVRIGLDEYEALRLMDFRKLTQAECAARMGVSRATVARMYERARGAVAEALVLGKRLKIEGGDVRICPAMKPECAGEPLCCHRHDDQNGGIVG